MPQPVSAEVEEVEPALQHQHQQQQQQKQQQWAQPTYHDLRGSWKSGIVSVADAASRSPSPVTTPSESSNYYAASTTSSWATSAGPTTDCGFPGDDDAERCGRSNKWSEDDAPRVPANRSSTPAGGIFRSMKGFPARSPSRPSSLRNSTSARDTEAETKSIRYGNADSESSDSECETAGESDVEDEEDDDDDEDDNEWSGQNGNLESIVISAVDGDLALAAYLIPLLHRDVSGTLKNKVESWQCTTTSRGSGSSDGSPDVKVSYTDNSPGQESRASRKRRRTNSDGRGEDDGGDDREDEDKKGGPIRLISAPQDAEELQLLLACPFHKLDPAKYGIQHGNSGGSGKKHRYRSCMGPGFKSIQRLKEHLKRVHSPVQCERCYEVFPGTDRAMCLTKLAEHAKMDIPCNLGDPSLKEGLGEAQWAVLDKQNRKKNQEVHRVEKWFEIWDVVFPGTERPKSPWHDIAIPYQPSSSPTKDGEDFAKLFLNILDHKHQQGDIELPDSQLLRDRLENVVRQTFKTYVSIHGNLSPEISSSESQHRRSSTLLSAPATNASHQLTATTAATSIASGQVIRTQQHPNTFTYGISPIPTQQHAPPRQQFLPGPPLAPPMHPGNHPHISEFAGMGHAADNAAGFYYSLMFHHPPPPPQGSPWGPPTGNVNVNVNAVPFTPSAHHLPQNFQVSMPPGSEHFYGAAESGSFVPPGAGEGPSAFDS
ncbi:hypothetical protein B0H63DRAFT_136532 [Podospora didyma]|uniref:C2H2-type domain-containing protein n=1 Tax=Podospora didyma TaxID=330526 RepID=A0AAE0NRL7_9PEZI|nr:hypothetical protein B0H63DRAFT_136532 [Podospora didyma]